MIGAAAIRPELLKGWLLAAVCLAAIFLPADIVFRRSVRETEAVRFELPRCGLLGIRWPTHEACLIANGPVPALSSAFSMQVMPWVRHDCGNRLDCVFLLRKVMEAMNADSGGAGFPPSAAVLSLPEPSGGEASRARPEDVAFLPDNSFHSVYTPGTGCTCTVRYRPFAMDVKVIVPGFDTIFPLPAAGSPRMHPAPDHSGENSAVVFRFSRGHTRAFTVVPPDHPLR